MIAELYLILDLLRGTVGDTPISPPSVKPQAVKQTKGSKANLAAGLFEVGPITTISQSFTLDLTNLEVPDWKPDYGQGRF